MASGQPREPDGVRRIVYNAGRALFGTSMAADASKSADAAALGSRFRWRTESSRPRMRANVKEGDGERHAPLTFFRRLSNLATTRPSLFAKEMDYRLRM